MRENAAALSHPNIVHAYDADEIGGTHLLVMEYIEGANDLAKLVKKNGPLPVEKACDYIRQAALGLQHAYERGMVHRDIKPANLLLTTDEKTVKVLDMGLARLDHAGTEEDDKSSTMTREGTVMGTPDYIAPEQAMDSHTVDIRADLYSLGCTFYFLLTGRVPFPGGTLMEKVMKHRLDEPKPVEQLRPDVPPEVCNILRKLMAKKPEDRYQTPAEAAAMLSGRRSGMANDVTIADGKDSLASAFEYMAKRDDTVALAAEKEKPKNRRWLLVGAFGSLFFVGLVVTLFVAFRGPAEKEPPVQAQKNEPLKKEETVPPKYVTNDLGMKFAWIPPGSFLMGSPEGEKGRKRDETQHKVTLTRGFYMGVYSVTQEEWQAVMGNNPSSFKGEKNLPVDMVSWNDCQAFIKKLREKDKKLYRLPSEAEWEYACRAGTTTAYSFGDDNSMLGQYAWFSENSEKKTHPVGQKKPNQLGLFDMHGNVWQWCQDLYGDYPQKEVVDPTGPEEGKQPVLRGGSWAYSPDRCRSAVRIKVLPGNRRDYFGLRVCFCLD